jgi:hypothetical protein
MIIYRIVTTWIVLATMLLCPFICLANASISLGSMSGKLFVKPVNCCCQCSDCDKSNNKAPCQRNVDGQIGTCICHGAVLQSPITPPSLDLGIVEISSVDDLLFSAKSAILADNLFVVNQTACHFPVAHSGIELRALIESLLI